MNFRTITKNHPADLEKDFSKKSFFKPNELPSPCRPRESLELME